MKKVLVFLLTTILLAMMSVFFVACGKQELDTPTNLSLTDGILIWDKVENANGYIVKVDEVEYTVTLNYFEVSVENGKTVEMAVKAIGSGRYSDSSFSEVYTYKTVEISELIKLNTPQISEITGDGRIYWSYVSNCSGYKIYKNNTVFATINDSKTTDYLLEITTPGSYSIQVQAIGDRKSYSDSAKSNVYKLVIEDDGTPSLPSLVAPTITYDPATRSLVWERNRKASSYDIYLNGEKIANTENTSYVVNPVLTTNLYQVVSVGDGVRYGNSKTGNSISFPLKPDSYPENLSLKVVNGERILLWDEQPYSLGYEIEINGSLVETRNAYMTFSSYLDGIYYIRVRSKGDNLVYLSSEFCNELEITVKDGQVIAERLQAPESVGFHNATVEWSGVEGADYYELLIETPYDDTLTNYTYKVHGLTFEIDETLLESVLVFYVKSCSDSALYSDSDFSKGIGYIPNARKEIHSDDGYVTIIEGDQYVFISTPSAISYDGEKISWSSINGASGYRLNIGEQQFLLTDNHFDYVFDGEIVVSVSAITDEKLTYPSPRSVEARFTGKQRLSSPTLTLSGSVLNWSLVDNAQSYLIVIDGLGSYTSESISYDLKNVIEYDGEYIIHVISVVESEHYINSLRSNEVRFIADYGAYGTKEKPFVIESIEDFYLIQENPNSYFRFSAKEYDFCNAEIEPLFVTDTFCGYILGEGALIKNLSILSVNGVCSFFGNLQGATIENLSFDNICISSAVTQGVLASIASECTIEGITISNCEFKGEAMYIGGLLGIGNGSILRCVVNVSMEVKPYGSNSLYAGGLAGSFNGSIKECYSTINFTSLNTASGESIVGGLVGGFIGSIEKSDVVDTSININTNGYGGLGFGQASGEMVDLRLSGNIIGKASNYLYLGGVAGTVAGKASGNISGLIRGESATLYMGGASGTGGVFTMTVKTKLRASADKLYLGGLCGSNSEKVIVEELELDIQASANKGCLGGIVGNGSAEGTLSGNIEINIKNSDAIFTMSLGTYAGNDDDKFADAPFTVSGNGVAS